jgi:hypothetical protein
MYVLCHKQEFIKISYLKKKVDESESYLRTEENPLKKSRMNKNKNYKKDELEHEKEKIHSLISVVISVPSRG